MNQLFLYATEKPIGQLKDFLQQLGLEFYYMILEFYDQVHFEEFTLTLMDNKENWLNRGRAFNEKMELKWRRKVDKFNIVLVSEDKLDAIVATKFDNESNIIPYSEKTDKLVILWGEYLDTMKESGKTKHRWFELRIPQPHLYPVSEASNRVRMSVATYIDDEGRQIMTRFIKPYPSGPKKEK